MKSIAEYVRSTPFIVCAHRGASGTAPENTMAALRGALDSGAMMIELDVQVTRDNALVVFHDDRLERTTNGTGDIHDITLAEARSLDAGSWFDPKFSAENIPLLADALDLLKGKAYLNIEIKPLRASARTAEILATIVAMIADRDMAQHSVFSSFDHHALLYVKSLDERLHTIALNIPGDERLPHEVVRDCKADGYGCSVEELTDEHIEDTRQHHIPIGVYTVNTPAELDYVLDMGVNGVVTNYPDVIMDHYRSRLHGTA